MVGSEAQAPSCASVSCEKNRVVSHLPVMGRNSLLEKDFRENFGKLLMGYSFPLHDEISTGRDFTVKTKTHGGGKTPQFVQDKGDIPHDSDEASFENIKAMRRSQHRHSRKKRRARKDRMRPMSGSDFDFASLIGPLTSLFASWKANSLWSLAPMIVSVLADNCPPNLVKFVTTWIDEKADLLQKVTIDDVTTFAQSLFSQWSLFSSGQLFDLASDFVNMVCTLVLAPSEFLPKIIQKRDQFFRYLSSVKSNSGDVISWLITTFAAVTACVKKFAESGSITEAFCMCTPIQEAVAAYDDSLLLYNNTILGLSDVEDFNQPLQDSIDKIERLSNIMSPVDSRRCAAFVSRIKAWKNELNVKEQGKAARIQPFAIAGTGSTGTGKTGLCYNLIPFLLKSNGFGYADKNIATPNMSCKHWDGITNEVLGMHWDDPDFMKPDYAQDSEYVLKMGRVLNNAQYLYDMAALVNKGTTVCHVKAVCLTSNAAEFGVDVVAKEPPAILRRFQVHLDIAVKPEFCQIKDKHLSTVIDSKKVEDVYGNALFPDIYEITAYDVLVVARKTNKRKTQLKDETVVHQTDRYAFVVSEHEGKRMQKIGIQELLVFLKFRSAEWFKSQRKLLERRSERDLLLCDGCGLPDPLCVCDIQNSPPSTSSGDDSENDDSQEEGSLSSFTDSVESEFVSEADGDSVEEEQDYLMGTVPGHNSRSGSLPCRICRRGFAPKSLWGYVAEDGLKAGICRSCLSNTRLHCDRCGSRSSKDVGMRKKPKHRIKVREYCKACTMRPAAGSTPLLADTLDTITKIMEREAMVNTLKDISTRNLRDLMVCYIRDGNEAVTARILAYNTFISQHSARFLSALLRKFFYYVQMKGYNTWQMWIPDGLEDGVFGHYLHARSEPAKWLRRLDQTVLTAGVVSSAYTSYRNPWLGAALTLSCGFAHSKLGQRPASKALLASLKARPALIESSVNTWRWLTSDEVRRKVRRAVKTAIYASPLLMLSVPCLPVSGLMSTVHAMVSPFTSLPCIGLCARTVQVASGTMIWLLRRSGIGFYPQFTAPYVLALYMSGSYLSDRKANYQVGRDLANVSAVYKGTCQGDAMKAWRNDTLPSLLKLGTVGKLMTTFAGVVCDIRLATGIKPMGGVLSIEDYSSLSGMSKEWYKKAWYSANLDTMPVEKKCVPQENINVLTANLLHINNSRLGEGCCAVAIRSKMMLVPGHILSDEYTRYIITRKDDNKGLCGNARVTISFRKKDARKVAPDLFLVEHTTLGDFKDISKHFISDKSVAHIPSSAAMIKRDSAGVVHTFSVENIVKENVTNNAFDMKKRQHWDGLSYRTDGARPGYCMSIIVTYGNPSVALGFALGGCDNGSGLGVSTFTSSQDLRDYAKAFTDSSSTIMTPCSGTLPQQMYNVNCVIQGVHPNSIAAHMPESQYKLYGSSGKVSKDSHDIVDTPIAEAVYEKMDIGKRWSAPPLEGKYSERRRKEKWLHTLEKYVEPKEMIEREILDLAVDDYLYGIDEVIANNPPSICRCLTDREVVEGIDGCEFITPLDANTSVGIPLEKKKRHYMESFDDGVCRRNRFVTEQFREQSLKSEKEYLAGRRAYPISKTFVKIEPTDVTKERCRLVYGAPMHMQWTVRKKFGAITKYICENPDFFECSVGVNAFGKDWKRMYDRLASRGCSRCVALDYKAYDATTSSQLIQAAFAVLIAIARKLGWSEEDIKIMEGVAADIMWPVINANGDVMQLFDGTISGHSLTTLINCIGNSLSLRVVFYTLYPMGQVMSWTGNYSRCHFRDYIVAYFYGDDLVATVDRYLWKFNNHAIVAVLGALGRTLTSYDKKTKIAKFDNLRNIEFLKRAFKYDRQLRTIVGPLNEASIYKRLVCVHKPTSPNTMYTLLGDNCESACAEWFLHGERTFNSRRNVLRQILSEHDDALVSVACLPALRVSYKERLRVWKSLYG